jgi:hypothetical protein
MHVPRVQNTPAILWFDLCCDIWFCGAISSHPTASKPYYVDFTATAIKHAKGI